MIFKIVALIIIILLLIVDYALVVIAHEAEERANRVYRVWKGEIRDEQGNR